MANYSRILYIIQNLFFLLFLEKLSLNFFRNSQVDTTSCPETSDFFSEMYSEFINFIRFYRWLIDETVLAIDANPASSAPFIVEHVFSFLRISSERYTMFPSEGQ